MSSGMVTLDEDGVGAVVRVTGMVNGGIRNGGGRVIVEGMADPG